MAIKPRLNRERILKAWLLRGLSDIYFAFDSDDDAFESNARFSEIMGLEKILKATLLYLNHTEYEALQYDAAKQVVNKLAMKWGHDFELMLNELERVGCADIKQLKLNIYDGYNGHGLIVALNQGYTEIRYPVPKLVSDNFPLSDGWYQDPLSSSGITKFIYAICNVCLLELSKRVDLTDVLEEFRAKFEHRESFERFNNCFRL